MSRLLRGALIVPTALLALLGLSACGGDDEAVDPSSPESSATQSSSPSESPSPSPAASASVPADAPACEDVWSRGATLPRAYAGCLDLDVYVERDALGCSSGQRLVTFDDRFYGVLGGEVRVSQGALDDDPGYRAAVRSCRA